MKLTFALAMFFTAIIFSPMSRADKIEVHRKEFKDLVADTDRYEKRMNELSKLKAETGDGPTLDNIVSEIADIHKKLLDIKGRKTKLTDHLRQAHPTDDLITEMSLAHRNELKAADKPGVGQPAKKDETLDQRLNKLLVQIGSQYSRTAKDREDFNKKAAKTSDTMVISVDAPSTKKKHEILQEDKDKYLKETMKAKMKIEAKKPTPQDGEGKAEGEAELPTENPGH